MGLTPDHVVQILAGILQTGRVQLAAGQQLVVFHHIGNHPGVGDYHFHSLFLAQIGEFLQHFVGGLKVNGQRLVGIRKLLGRQQNMTVHLILRFQKMHVTGGTHRLTQLLAQTNYGTVKLPQLLLGMHRTVPQHEGVVAQWLDLQEVVIGRDTFQLVPVLVIHHRLEQLARFAGRTYDQTFPVLVQFALGNNGHTLKILQIGHRNQLIEILHAHLVSGNKDDVLWETVAFGALRPQLLHLPIDGLQCVDSPFMEHLPEWNQHISHRSRVIRRTMMIKVGQIQSIRHNIQLVFPQIRQQILCQNQGVDICGVELQPHLPAAGTDEADVKLRVMSRQRTPIHEIQKFCQCIASFGC